VAVQGRGPDALLVQGLVERRRPQEVRGPGGVPPGGSACVESRLRLPQDVTLRRQRAGGGDLGQEEGEDQRGGGHASASRARTRARAAAVRSPTDDTAGP